MGAARLILTVITVTAAGVMQGAPAAAHGSADWPVGGRSTSPTGAAASRRWTPRATGEDAFDTWNGGPDHDFADGAHLLTVEGRKLVGAGQKSGIYWMVDALTGEIVWSAAAGPGSAVGGIQWGTATDGERVYLVETNFFRQPYELPNGQVIDYSSIAALDAATGEVVWQIPEPHGGLAQGAVSVANGVLYAGSLGGSMYALDAATGQVLWETQGQGSSNAGPAIADGTVYWGNGYERANIGTPSRTFYAFGLPTARGQEPQGNVGGRRRGS